MGFRHGFASSSGSQRVDAPSANQGVVAGLNSRLSLGEFECVTHGCCGPIMAPTGLERTQDMRTATVPARSCGRSHATHASAGLALRPPSLPCGARKPRARALARNHTPSAEGACEVTRPRCSTLENDSVPTIRKQLTRTNDYGGRGGGGQQASRRVRRGLFRFIACGCQGSSATAVYIQPGCQSSALCAAAAGASGGFTRSRSRDAPR